jgi:hypothetical protein
VQYDRRLSVRVPDTFPEDPVATASLEDSRVEGLDDRIRHQAIIAPANQRRSVESLGGSYRTSADPVDAGSQVGLFPAVHGQIAITITR